MDKETLSNYGWIVICVLVLAVMIALATPFGSFISEAIQSTTKGLFDVNKNALDAAGVPGLTVQDQEFDVPDMNQGTGGSGTQTPKELTTVTAKTWNGNVPNYGESVWTDGTYTYYTRVGKDYVLNGDTWEQKTLNGLNYLDYDGRFVWTDGTNTYYKKTHILNGDTWEQKTLNGGPRNFYGDYVWTDGTHTYYSSGTSDTQYILNGDTWETKTWNGFTDIDGRFVWTDGTNTYYSNGDKQYVLNGNTWEIKIWNVSTELYGWNVWSDGTNTYYSGGSNQYVLNGDTWETKTWTGLTKFIGKQVWTDGTNYYYSNSTEQYVFS